MQWIIRWGGEVTSCKAAGSRVLNSNESSSLCKAHQYLAILISVGRIDRCKMQEVLRVNYEKNLASGMSQNTPLDPVNQVECEIEGGKVRLLFLRDRNEKVERLVLENLMDVFEHRAKLGSSLKKSG